VCVDFRFDIISIIHGFPCLEARPILVQLWAVRKGRRLGLLFGRSFRPRRFALRCVARSRSHQFFEMYRAPARPPAPSSSSPLLPSTAPPPALLFHPSRHRRRDEDDSSSSSGSSSGSDDEEKRERVVTMHVSRCWALEEGQKGRAKEDGCLRRKLTRLPTCRGTTRRYWYFWQFW